MNDHPPNTLSRRRVLIGSLGGVALAALGFGWLRRRGVDGLTASGPGGVDPTTSTTVVAYIGAMFGKSLSERDVSELSARLNLRVDSDANFADECTALAQFLDRFARDRGAATFVACDDLQKDSIVQQIMSIDASSVVAKLRRRISRNQSNYYRMRWSTMWQLSWLYSQSGVAWRARGYDRWPGIPGDWHEIVAPGPSYP